MDGNRLVQDLFLMNEKRCKTKESVLALLTFIRWPEHIKFGIDIYRKNSDSVEFIIYKNSKILDPADETIIKSIVKKEMPDLEASDNWGNIIYMFLMRLSLDDVLTNHLKDECGIYFYIDSYEVRLTISKEGLSKL